MFDTVISKCSAARFCFELSVNSNYSVNLLHYPLIFDEAFSRLERKSKIRINRVRPVVVERFRKTYREALYVTCQVKTNIREV